MSFRANNIALNPNNMTIPHNLLAFEHKSTDLHHRNLAQAHPICF